MDRNDVLRDFPLAVALIQAEEGFRDTPYRCSQNKLTIGYGYNITAHGHTEAEAAGWVWSHEQARDALLDELLDVVASLDARYPRWRDLLNADREAVALSAVYQLGTGGAAKFVNTIAKIRSQDWDGAAAGILASKWAHQTPERAQRNAEAMRTGKLPEVVNGVRLVVKPVQIATPAPAQPSACVLPLVPADVQTQSQAMGDAVRAVGVPVAGAVSVGGVVLSKKLCTLAGACAVVMFGPQFGLHLDAAQLKTLGDMIVTYLAGQSAVDTLKPIIAPFMPAIADWLRGCVPTSGARP